MTAATERRASPLAGWSERFAAVSADPARFAIRELAFTTQLILRGDRADAAFCAAVRHASGVELPVEANTWSGAADRGALWLGPDEWLLTAPDEARDALLAALGGALRGSHHALVDVSANRTLIGVSGDCARAVLAKGCALDLHARAFAAGRCAQTLLAKAQVILQCGPDMLHLHVRNSFADYLARWLTDAAAETRASHALDAARLAARLG